MNLRGKVGEIAVCIQLAQDKNQWRILVNTV